jgi:hypothetical protein
MAWIRNCCREGLDPMGRKRGRHSEKEATSGADPSPPSPTRIFISYAHAEPDQALAEALKDGLVQAGHRVYIDTEIKIGADWGATILDWMAASDFLVLLLSARSVHSEMVREEARLAHGRREAEGSPRLLPVRVNYTGPLGYALGAWVNPYQWTSWEQPDDTGRVLRQILDVVEGGSAPPPADLPSPEGPFPSDNFRRPEPMADLSQFARPGGKRRPDDPFWVERAVDREVRDIAHGLEETVVIKAPRQMGKSTLLGRYLSECSRAGKKTALIDLSGFEERDLADYPKFLTLLATELLYRLKLEGAPTIAGQVEMTRFVHEKILGEIHDNLVLSFDEVDRVFGQPYQSDFFGMLRTWNEQRADLTQPEWARLELALVISTEPYLLISDAKRSPFNVRVPIELHPFNQAECRELNQLHGQFLSDDQVERLRSELLEGHPFLTRVTYFRLMRPGAPSLEDLIRDAPQLDGPFGDHLRGLLVKLRENTKQDLLAALRQVIRHKTVPNDDAFVRLRGAGLVRRDGDKILPANGLYARFFGNLR